MSDFKIAVQLFSIRDAMEKDFEGTLKRVKEIGYDYVEFFKFYDYPAKEVKRMLDEIGLIPVSTHKHINYFLEEGQSVIDYQKEIGLTKSAIPSFRLESWIEDWDGSMKAFSDYSAALKKAGIQLYYHNHVAEFEKDSEGVYFIDKLLNSLPSDVLNPQFDTGLIYTAGQDPIEYLEKYAGRVEMIHIKDILFVDEGGPAPVAYSKPLGQGEQDLRAILETCKKVGTEIIVVEQEQVEEGDPLSGIKASLDHLKSLGY